MADIFKFPNRAEIEWRHIADAIHSGTLDRTGSIEIADAVTARCRKAFDAAVPQPYPFSQESEDVLRFIEAAVGVLIAEVAMLAEEVESLKTRG